MDRLFDRVYGALIGAAIGDAMGGPVEMYHYEEISKKFGWINTLMPYGEDISIGAHGPWAKDAGTYTDDSRMSKLFCKAIIEKNGACISGDLRKMYAKEYHLANEGLEKSFLEEYYYKAMYGESKQVFGGQPTNGAIMAIAPFGVIHPCDPQRAHDEAFESMFIVEGYSRYSAAMAAAAISAAMIPKITPTQIIDMMMDSIKNHKSRVEGHLWSSSSLYQSVGLKNELLVKKTIEIALKHKNTKTLQKELYDVVCQQFVADGSESLAIALCMFVASEGDYRGTVEGCVNFGRDNDSSASVGGALAGAFCGAHMIPAQWIELVEKVNPVPNFEYLAKKICEIIRHDYFRMYAVIQNMDILLKE